LLKTTLRPILKQAIFLFEKHLAGELERVVKRLAFEVHTLNERGEERETSLKIILHEEEKELRKRLLSAKGRVPIKHQDDFKPQKEKFINECLQGLDELTKSKKNINRHQLAKILFRDENPFQSLRRKLKNFDVSFEEILQKYSEQKSS
jgi:hypothetical protein